MQHFTRILVSIDAASKQQAALDRAAVLARACGGQLFLAEVVEDLPAPLRFPAYGYPALSETLAAEKKAALERLAAPLREGGLEVETWVLRGKPATVLIQEALRKSCDLLVRATSGGAGPALFGSLELRLLEKCPCPVWLVKGGGPGGYSRILAAVDPASEDEVEQKLNRRILELASSMAQLEQAELDVIHVWKRYDAGAAGVPEESRAGYAEATRDFARQRFGDLLRETLPDLPESRTHLIEGEPADAIAKFAEDHRADLIVMGTLTRRTFPWVFMGSTAERVLARMKCSVLAIKPEGFVSPVTLPGS